MLKEGTGKTCPLPVDWSITRGLLDYYANLAKSREGKYAHSSRVWQKGLISRPTLTGFVAEWAFATWVNWAIGGRYQPDERPLAGGDNGIDFTICGIPIQVKGRGRCGDLLIRRETEDGRLIPYPWQICVVATWKDAGPDAEPNLRLTLDGWVSKNVLRNDGRFVEARRGNHMNLEIPDEELESMSDLITILTNKRG